MKKIASILYIAGMLFGLKADPVSNLCLNPVKIQTAATHVPLKLIENGKLNFVLVADLKAESGQSVHRQSVSLAVEALQKAFERCTGMKPEVLAPDSENTTNLPYRLLIGDSPHVRQLGFRPLDLPQEGFLVATFPQGVVIAGHDGSLIPDSYNRFDWIRYRLNGTCNAAYDFIERFLGVRFYYPGIGVYAPSVQNLTLNPVHYQDQPEYKNRYSGFYAFAHQFRKNWPWPEWRDDSRDFDKAWRIAMSTRFEPSHSPVAKRMAETFPEKIDTLFYTDRSGYQYYTPASRIGNYFDVSNPDFAQLMVQSYEKFYATNGKWREPWGNWYPPNSEFVYFGQEDTFLTRMETENALPLQAEERRHSRAGSLSDVYADFYIRLGNLLKERLPDKKLGVLFYHAYTLPPLKKWDFPDNIRATLCMGRPLFIKSKAASQPWVESFRKWNEVLRHPVSAWLYQGGQNNAFTRSLQGRYVKDFLQLLSPYLWREGVFVNFGWDWHLYYSYYPALRALWNPEFNVNAALDEHWEKLYGVKAGPKLREFYALLLDRWENHYLPAYDGGKIDSGLLYKVYNIPVISKLESLLADARSETAEGSIEQQRVDFFAQPWSREFTVAKAFISMSIPVYKVAKLNENDTILIDGVLNDTAWQQVPQLLMQDAMGAQTQSETIRNAKLLWSSKGLYLAFSAQGKPAVNPGDIWFNSDHIELFLSPGTEKELYFQFASNANNDFYDAWRRLLPIEAALDKHWICPGVRHAAKFDDQQWSAEWFIPFSGLNTEVPKAYQTWFANFIFGRHQPKEYRAFSLTMGNNHNLDLFGKIKFMGRGD